MINFSNFKFNRGDDVGPLLWIFSHWLNPLGNYHEPLPYPEKRFDQFTGIIGSLITSKWFGWLFVMFPPWAWHALEIIWWNLYRNPFHNFNHFWIGITPLGERYEWIAPQAAGWRRQSGYLSPDGQIDIWLYKRSWLTLPIAYFSFRLAFTEVWFYGYVGWMKRGNFGMALRREK